MFKSLGAQRLVFLFLVWAVLIAATAWLVERLDD